MYLCAFSGCGTHGPAEDLLDNIWQQADCNEEDDAEPGRTAGQHLHEHVVHPLVVQEGPEQQNKRQKAERKKKSMTFLKYTDQHELY